MRALLKRANRRKWNFFGACLVSEPENRQTRSNRTSQRYNFKKQHLQTCDHHQNSHEQAIQRVFANDNIGSLLIQSYHRHTP